ncbi:MAG: hypothetical protein AN485_23310, partial [Anabaena sp. MDT14b]
VQIVSDPQLPPDSYEQANALRNEYVVTITCRVTQRPPESLNPRLPTGVARKRVMKGDRESVVQGKIIDISTSTEKQTKQPSITHTPNTNRTHSTQRTYW